MENIQIFLDASEAYGVQKTSLFQTVDLFEARNMSQVINTIMQLGTEVFFSTLERFERIHYPATPRAEFSSANRYAPRGSPLVRLSWLAATLF